MRDTVSAFLLMLYAKSALLEAGMHPLVSAAVALLAYRVTRDGIAEIRQETEDDGTDTEDSEGPWSGSGAGEPGAL